MVMQEIKNVLENCEFFSGLEQSFIDKIADLCRVETYEPGKYVFRQGDFGEQLFVIAEGYIFLERAMDLGKGKGNVVIGILGKGRVFGCWSTLLGEPHKLLSSATCQKPTKIVTMMSLRTTYQRGGLKALDQQFQKTLETFGPGPSNVSIQQLLEGSNGL